MNSRKLTLFSMILGLFFTAPIFAQTFDLGAQFRPRMEYNNGYKTLIGDGIEAGTYISQRTRFNLNYSNAKLDAKLSLQNVGVWGETSTLSSSDINGQAVHEAWVRYHFGDRLSLKTGRQEIIYDDHRIFGSVNWAQQGRSHDAAVLSFKRTKTCKLDLGFALNNDKANTKSTYYPLGQYKAMQYLHWNKKFGEHHGLSILALNNGLQYQDLVDTTSTGLAKNKIVYSQTLGFRYSYKNDKLKGNIAAYYQMGNIAKDTTTTVWPISNGFMNDKKELNAYYFAADVSYQIAKGFTAGVAVEMLSGNDMDSMGTMGTVDNSFKPLYGTNHKFNGWMDYFYVGSHMGSVGLMDISVPLVYKKDKMTFKLIPHMFSAVGTIYGTDANNKMVEFDANLGTEIDFMFIYKMTDDASLMAGYSHLLATESMQVLKGGNFENTQNWAWVGFNFTPTFFKTKK